MTAPTPLDAATGAHAPRACAVTTLAELIAHLDATVSRLERIADDLWGIRPPPRLDPDEEIPF